MTTATRGPAVVGLPAGWLQARLAGLLGAALLTSGCIGPADPLESPPAACTLSDETRIGDELDRKSTLGIAKRGPLAYGPWTSGHGIAIHGQLLYVADPDNDAVHVIDREALKVLRTVAVGGGPERLVVAPDGDVYVAQRYGDRVLRLAQGNGPAVDGGWTVGAGVRSVALTPDAKRLAVVVRSTRQLLVLDPKKGTILASAKTDVAPTAVACNEGFVAVAHQNAPVRKWSLSALLSSGAVDPHVSALDTRPTSRLCVNDQDNGRLASRALSMAVEPDTGRFAVAHVSVDPGRPGAGASVAEEPADPAEMRCAALGMQTLEQVSAGIQARAQMWGYGGAVDVEAPDCRDPVRPVDPVLSFVSSGAAEHDPVFFGKQRQGPLKRLGSRPLSALVDAPSDVVFDPVRRLSYVAGSGSDNVLVLNDASVPVGLLDTRAFPRAMALSPDGQRLYVVEGHVFRVAEFDLSGWSLSMSVTDPLRGAAQRRVRYAKDPLPTKMRMGRRVFHNANNPRLVLANAFACATCHPDGQDDRVTWFVPAGPRQTPSLAGRLVGTGPFTWSGEAPFLSVAMRDSVSRVGGTGLTEGEMSSLVAYLEGGLRPPATPTGVDVAAVARGKAIFHSPEAGCGSCHIGGAGTDGHNHDVGTRTKLDGDPAARFNTPSLRGIAATAPYFHDGSSPDLKSALKRTASTMGRVTHLDDAELDDLVAYLRTL